MKKQFSRFIIPLGIILVVVFACQIFSDSAILPHFVLPQPSLILDGLIKNWRWFLANLQVTMMEAAYGFLLGVTIAITLALSYLFIRPLEPVIVPLTVAIVNVPFVAVAPILFIVLGYGSEAKIFIVALVTFFPVMSNLTAGFNSVNQNLRERFYVLHASRWQVFTKLELPAAIPHFTTGLQIAVAGSVIGAIVGELLGATKGMGFVILMTISQYKIAVLMAAVLMITIASILFTWLIRQISSLLFHRWIINR